MRRWATFGVGAVFLVYVACGSEGGGEVAPVLEAGAPDGRVEVDGAGVDSGVDSGPARAPFGLDVRPVNGTCLAPKRPVDAANGISTVIAFPSLPVLSMPVAMMQRPGDSSFFHVVEQFGAIKRFANAPGVSVATVVLELPASKLYAEGGEAGLLGMAFDPKFAANGIVYLSYTAPGNVEAGGTSGIHSVISRWRSLDGGVTIDPASEQVILVLQQPFANHNGGNIAFGPDGHLYIGFGDGGEGSDPFGNGQNTSKLLGKMLRVSVGATGTYTIPPSNPFATNGLGRPEIFALGFRNPWRWSFDRGTGELWVGDVGESAWEEIDRVELGGNYGWNLYEGHACFDTPAGCDASTLTPPVVDYPHEDSDQAVIGGYVYRGSAIPSLVGTYLFMDYVSGRVRSIAYDPITGAASRRDLTTVPGGFVTSFGEGHDGELYTLGLDGKIRRIAQAVAPPADTFPRRLSETGCVDPKDPRAPAAGLIAYDLNAAFWSDGAEKRRWMALPDGKAIKIGADGDWDLPRGTVLMKEFTLAGKRIETRLFMRHDDDSWAGYSYEWNDGETEATLLAAGKSRVVGAETWTYPSRAQCLQCHGIAPGRTLGLEDHQMNRDLVYPATNRISNQIATLAHIGVLEGAAREPASLPRLPSPSGADPLEARARSYLHANCSFCHRPKGIGQGPANFLFDTPASKIGVCGATPATGTLGIAGAKLVAPGLPAKSVVSARMHALDVHRMPPVASRRVDAAGTKLIDDWITATTTCP